MRWHTLLLIAGLLCGGLQAGAAAAPPSKGVPGRLGPPIEIAGNLVLIEDVYRAVLKLPPDALVDEATAAAVRKQLLDFLRRSGYVLAKVEARVQGEVIRVEIDEGRLAKVVFLGYGTLKTLQLKLKLSVPHNVYNRPNLQRQLKGLGERYGIPDIQFKLVPVGKVEHSGPQIEDLGDIGGIELVPPPARYELHILLAKSDWGTGLGVDLDYDFPDGLTLEGFYRGRGMLFRDDRWQVGVKAGGKIQKDLEDGHSYLALTRAQLGWKWFTPALVGKGLRPYLWLQSDLESGQRRDLRIEIYYAESLEGSLNVGYEFTPGLMSSLGGGIDERIVFGVDQLADAPAMVSESSRLRPFVLGRVDFSFDTDQLRRDRAHQLALEVRHYWFEGRTAIGVGSLQYQKVFEFGWHDLWLQSRGKWLWGNVLFDDEEPVGGRYVRGVFGDRYFVHRVANLMLEFRLSIARELYKVGVFNDLAVFGELNRVDGGEQPRIADSFGLGFHALILDLLQFDLYYSFGLSSDGGFDHGLSASLKKVF